jgi:hypothetical protein
MTRAALLLLFAGATSSLGCSSCNDKWQERRLEEMSKAPLDATSTLPNKLATVHYPKLFVVSRQTEGSFVINAIEHQMKFRTEDIVFVVTNPKPVTEVLDEYVRISHEAISSKLTAWTETSREHTVCFHDVSGVELRGNFTLEGTAMKLRSCSFFHQGHGYVLGYMVGRGVPGDWDEKLMRRIVDATELPREGTSPRDE